MAPVIIVSKLEANVKEVMRSPVGVTRMKCKMDAKIWKCKVSLVLGLNFYLKYIDENFTFTFLFLYKAVHTACWCGWSACWGDVLCVAG